MAIPAEGLGAIGIIAAWLVREAIPRIQRRRNGNNANSNSKPGKASVCIKRGEKLVEHDTIIKHLCELSEKADKQYEVSRKENREDHQLMFEKLDELK